jgi:Family of unknown function (DUF6151)
VKEVNLTCKCGKVSLELRGEPILTADCTCTSCRTAGAILEKLPDAEPLLDQYGATRLVLYRKDRFACLSGDQQLREFRLRPDSTTRRVIATCCNSPMFLDFTKGHWINIYGQRWQLGATPVPELRTMTMDLPDGTTLPDDIPNSRRQSLMFFAKLVSAWIAMRFRTPKITCVNGAVDVSQ